MLLLHYFCKNPRFCWRSYYVGHHVIAFILVVACMSALEGSLAITVFLADVCCWRDCWACIAASAGIPALAGVPLVPDVLIVACLSVTVASPLWLAFLLLLSSLLLLALLRC